MSTGDLMGTIASVFGLFTCKEILPAVIWLVLAITFGIRFERTLDRMDCGEDEYKCLEEKDE